MPLCAASEVQGCPFLASGGVAQCTKASNVLADEVLEARARGTLPTALGNPMEGAPQSVLLSELSRCWRPFSCLTRRMRCCPSLRIHLSSHLCPLVANLPFHQVVLCGSAGISVQARH